MFRRHAFFPLRDVLARTILMSQASSQQPDPDREVSRTADRCYWGRPTSVTYAGLQQEDLFSCT
jgi:hypothetical protein